MAWSHSWRSRRRDRGRASDRSGEPILLLEQDRGKRDHLLIRRGLAALERAERLGGTLGPYALQAAIAANHSRLRTAAETDWTRIAALYDALAEVIPTPVVHLNRAVAIGMAYGPLAGLEIVDALTTEPALRAYHLLPSVRGALLEKLGRFSEAHGEFERAASLAKTSVTARFFSSAPQNVRLRNGTLVDFAIAGSTTSVKAFVRRPH